MERRELDAVPVDLADVEVLADFGDVRGRDVVGSAPDAFARGMVHVGEGRPVRVVNQRGDAAWGGGRAAVIFAGGGGEGVRERG